MAGASTFVDLLGGRGGRAAAIGAALVRRGLTGHRVLVALPPGAGFAAALLGCLHAGVVAVPVAPEPSGRLAEIVDDARPAAAFGTVPGVEPLTGLADRPCDRRLPEVDPDDLALVQYAATGPVRGVMLTHGNLAAGATQLVRHLGMRADTGVVNFLPPHRDLGLIGGVLAPLLVGAPVTHVAADASPDGWLRAISDRRARISFAPDLAYAWQTEAGVLDLSTWDVAVTGAAAATLDRFAEHLAPQGFRRSSFFPAYWSAEATALVTGRPGLVAATFDEDSLEPGRFARAGTTALVDRGRVVSGLRVVIVDPLTGTRCPDGTTGEVWVAGPNVAAGYLGRPLASEQTFCARLRGSTENYLRTGELGFLRNGGLHLVDAQPLLVTR